MQRRKFEALFARGAKVGEREIIALRNEYLLRISKIVAKDAFAPFAAKADELLKARYWSNATWREREKILDTVSWLLRVHAPR